MNIKLKTALITASIVILLIAAVLVVFIGRKSENYEDRLIQAGVYLENRDYDNAIAIYNGIISENRSCAEAYAGLSEAYFAKSRTDKALEILEKGAANTDNDKIITDKRNELFPDMDMQYADIAYDDDDYYTYDDYGDDFSEDADLTAETSAPEAAPEAESSETGSEVTTVSEQSESETTVTTTAATTVPTTAATTVPTTTAAPVIVTTAPPVVTTAPPVTTQVTTRATTTPTTVTTTTVTTTTEALKDVSVPDLTRMTLDEAYAWCSKNNIILNVVGAENDSSKILSQSPAPNATVKENSSVIVVLEE